MPRSPRIARSPLAAAIALALGVLLAACGDSKPTGGTPGGGAATAGETKRPRIAVIPKGTTHVFWQSVHAGARDAGAAAGLDVVWKGPLQESDRAQQIELVQQFVAEGVAGLALAPMDHTALVPAVAAAKRKGIPVVVFDSGLDGEPGVDFVSFVATDNHKAGVLAGAHLATLLGGKGKVAVLRYQEGSASTLAREAGCLQAVRAAGLEVVLDNRFAGASIGEAKTTALNLADVLRSVQGVFCSNESATNGMLQALRQLGLARQVRFVGFDASPPLLDALRDGAIDALVVQDPRKMGELSVHALADAIAGRPATAVVDTGAVLVTKGNVDEPALQRLWR